MYNEDWRKTRKLKWHGNVEMMTESEESEGFHLENPNLKRIEIQKFSNLTWALSWLD